MTIERTKFGLPFLDDAVGGVYLGLPALVKGARNSGKTVLAAHFVDRVLRIGEKAILFCETAPEAAILEARSAGIDLEPAVHSGQLLLVPLRDAVGASRGAFPFDTALAELRALASRSSVGFAAFSSVVPWLAATPVTEMPRRVDAFLAALSSLSLTSLLLVHKPASAPAARLVEKLSASCPVVFEMTAFESAQRELRVVKYDGRNDLRLPLVFPLDLVPGKGLVPPAPAEPAVPAPVPRGSASRRSAAPPSRRRSTLFGATPAPDTATVPAPQRRATLFSAATAPAPVPPPALAPASAPASAPAPARAPAAAPAAAPQRRPTLFSSVIDREPAPPDAAPARPAAQPQPPPNRPSRIRFSDVIR